MQAGTSASQRLSGRRRGVAQNAVFIHCGILRTTTAPDETTWQHKSGQVLKYRYWRPSTVIGDHLFVSADINALSPYARNELNNSYVLVAVAWTSIFQAM